MPNEVIIAAVTQDDLSLIVEALSAYQHNTRYRALYEKMMAQAAVTNRLKGMVVPGTRRLVNKISHTVLPDAVPE